MMNTNENKPTPAEVKKQNQDFPNIPASSEKIKEGGDAKKQIKETSKLNEEGKTDNTEHNSGN